MIDVVWRPIASGEWRHRRVSINFGVEQWAGGEDEEASYLREIASIE
jgi:hypothetical protein